MWLIGSCAPKERSTMHTNLYYRVASRLQDAHLSLSLYTYKYVLAILVVHYYPEPSLPICKLEGEVIER